MDYWSKCKQSPDLQELKDSSRYFTTKDPTHSLRYCRTLYVQMKMPDKNYFLEREKYQQNSV